MDWPGIEHGPPRLEYELTVEFQLVPRSKHAASRLWKPVS